MAHHADKKIVQGIILLFAGCLWLAGCSDLPPIKEKVKGPWISDSLIGNKIQGISDNGTFSPAGWTPGTTGTLTYDLPGLIQGVIEFDVKGLNRSAKDTVIVTMFEKPPFDYVNPYINNNPFRVTLAMNNFQKKPAIPFELFWSIKNFPAATGVDDRYVKGIPTGVDGIEKTSGSSNVPVFLDQTYRIKIEWMHGMARYYVNGQQVGEIDYQPLSYNAKALRIVFGKTPGADSFDLPNLVFSNVVISFPKL